MSLGFTNVDGFVLKWDFGQINPNICKKMFVLMILAGSPSLAGHPQIKHKSNTNHQRSLLLLPRLIHRLID